MKKLLLLGIVTLGAFTAKAQLNPVTWTFTAKKISDKTYEISMTATLKDKWHLYSQIQPADVDVIPTTFTINANPLFTKEGKVILADTAVKEMNKVHQLCGGTVKTEESEAMVIDSSKADYIKEKFAGQKIAIYYKYVAELAALQFAFAGRLFYDPMQFNKAGVDAVFVSQVQSGREGVNLSTADCLVMYNIDYSAVSYWQVRARLQTKDRVKDAKVYWLFFEGGIEEKIYNCVEQKKDFTLSHYNKLLKKP